MNNLEDAINYLKNTGGGATKENFLEDAEPIGHILWKQLEDKKLVKIVNGKIYPTSEGK